MAYDSKGWYKLFELEPGADLDAIKTKYKQMSVQLHPNGNERRKIRESDEFKRMSPQRQQKKEEELDQKLVDINMAYNTFTNKVKKEEYDKGIGDFYVPKTTPSSGYGSNYNNNYNSGSNYTHNYNHNYGRPEPPKQPKMPDTITYVRIPEDQARMGRIKKFKVKSTRMCGPCFGLGYSQTKRCPQCDGKGRVWLQTTRDRHIVRQEVFCNKCKATGSVGVGAPCLACKGEKSVKIPFIIDVPIRAGTRDGEQIVYEGQGNQAMGYRAGDLVFIVKIERPYRY